MSALAVELRRKAVHVGMGGGALLLRWLTPRQALLLAIVALLFNLLVLHRVTRLGLMREVERAKRFSRGIVLYPSAVLALLLAFQDRLELAAAAWALLAFGDGMATVSGLLLRGPALPWNPGKTWSGSIAFVLWGSATSAFLLRWTQQAALEGRLSWIGSSFLTGGSPGQPDDILLLFSACLAAAALAALVESSQTAIDDNILVPLVGGTVLYALTLVEPDRLAATAGGLATPLVMGALINGVLAFLAFAAKGVSLTGALSGWVLGTALFALGGWGAFLMLFAFFVLGTAATKSGFARKAACGIAQEAEGRRGAKNAFAKTGAGVGFAFLAATTPYGPLFMLALVAAFATAASDTVASEIGQAFGRNHYLVTSFRRVRAGTDGAVSLEGTLAGMLASLLIGFLAFTVGIVPVRGVAIVVAAAFLGTTFESYLGATLERMKLLDNEFVNFTSTVAGGLAAILISAWG